jgi:cyclophilin family peptidyl-prolyl cis-trans isomerase
MMLRLTAILLLAAAAGACGSSATSSSSSPISGTPATIEAVTGLAPMSYDSPPPMTIDSNSHYVATLETERGDIVIHLFSKEAPRTVNNFVFLAREGFYNDTTFHRVIAGFMAQGGDPTGTGSGGPGYRFADEFNPALRHDSPGILSMANAGPNTNGSQFFITHGPTPHLDDHHAVFGKVTNGMDVLLSLSPRDPASADFLGDSLMRVVIQEPAS